MFGEVVNVSSLSTQPQPGDCLLVYGDSWIMDGIATVEAIGMAERGEHRPRGTPLYAHAAIYLGGGRIAEALGQGVVESPLSKYAGSADVWSRDITRHQREEIVRQAQWMADQHYRYNYWDIAVQFVWLTLRLHLPWRLKHSVICSVTDYVCWLAGGYEIAKTANPDPEDIALGGVLQRRGTYRG